MTEFYLRVSWRFYIGHSFIPTPGYNTPMTNNEYGIACVTRPDVVKTNEVEALPYTIYFDTQENMMNFQLKYL